MTESQLIEDMAKAMFANIHHYHEKLTWDKAHPETQNLYISQAKAGYNAIRAHVTFGH